MILYLAFLLLPLAEVLLGSCSGDKSTSPPKGNPDHLILQPLTAQVREDTLRDTLRIPLRVAVTDAQGVPVSATIAFSIEEGVAVLTQATVEADKQGVATTEVLIQEPDTIRVRAAVSGGEAAVEFTLIAHPAETPVDKGLAQLVFRSNRDSPGDIFIMNVDGTGLRNLTAGLEPPAYSPAVRLDGSKVAFTWQPKGEPHGLYAMDMDGGHMERLTELVFIGRPSWSPDGSQLAFAAESFVGIDIEEWKGEYGQGGWTPHDIFILNWADRSIRNVTQHPVPNPDPVWSPDGSQIAFQQPYTRSNVGDLWVIEADGTQLRQVTYQDSVRKDFSWSPDGTQLVYTAYSESSGYWIWFMNLDGSGKRSLNLPPEFQAATHPAWSPDGQKIAFLGADPVMDAGDIWVVNVDGTGAVNLTNHPGYYYDITWIQERDP